MNQQKIEKELRFLKTYAGVATLLITVFLLTAFSVSKNAKFDEIDVKRINVKDDDGKLRMVISNKDRQHYGISDGKPIERKNGRPTPGIIFFNHLGDEMGGLVVGENGGKGHFGSLTFDKVQGDQTIGFRHLEGKDGYYESGLTIWQQPNIPYSKLEPKYDELRKITDKAEREKALQKLLDKGEITTTRLFVGKTRDEDTTIIRMSDIKGKPRIVMSVEANGNPKLNFLDENGKVIYSLPEDAKAKK
jgi:thioredoxin-related protein